MKPALKFGLINGGIGVLWSLLLFITGLNRSDSATMIMWLAIIIPIVCITLAVKEHRLNEGNGWVSFGVAFRTGFKVTLFGSIIGAVYHFLFLTVIDPSFIDFQMNQQMEKMQERGMSEEIIDQAMKTTKTFMAPGMQFVFAIIFGLLIGVIIALIMAAILKKPNPEGEIS